MSALKEHKLHITGPKFIGEFYDEWGARTGTEPPRTHLVLAIYLPEMEETHKERVLKIARDIIERAEIPQFIEIEEIDEYERGYLNQERRYSALTKYLKEALQEVPGIREFDVGFYESSRRLIS